MQVKSALAVLVAGCSLSATASTYTDLWNDPAEPGWGVNVVQQLETAFITLFVYGDDGKPAWLVASDARIVALSSGGGFPVFSGTLYRTQGPLPGVSVQPVGTVSLEVLAKDRMRVEYTADGKTVRKEVRRYTFQPPVPFGIYEGQMLLRQVHAGQVIGTLQLQAQMTLELDARTGQMSLSVLDQLQRRCDYRGPYEATGKLVRASGSFTCNSTDALAGTFEIRDLEINDNGVTGFLQTASGSDSQSGRFGAARL